MSDDHGGAKVAYDVRYQRHLVLREIGPAGQARLLAATAQLPLLPAFAEDVATRYARRAGFGQVEAAADVSAPVAPAWMTTPAARSLLVGSLSALTALRLAIGMAPAPPAG